MYRYLIVANIVINKCNSQSSEYVFYIDLWYEDKGLTRKCILFFQKIQIKSLNKNHVEIAIAFIPNVSQYWWNTTQYRYCSISPWGQLCCVKQVKKHLLSLKKKISTYKDTIISFVVKNINNKITKKYK